MGFLSIHILVVDDYEHWRRFVLESLEKEPELQVVAEASDGLDAVRKADELQPDVILLDIGLPKLNGIEAARQMRQIPPNSKILFFSENRSVEIIEEAMRCGARGFVLNQGRSRSSGTRAQAEPTNPSARCADAAPEKFCRN